MQENNHAVLDCVLHSLSSCLWQQGQAAAGSTTPASTVCKPVAACLALVPPPTATNLFSSHTALSQYWELSARKARGECVTRGGHRECSVACLAVVRERTMGSHNVTVCPTFYVQDDEFEGLLPEEDYEASDTAGWCRQHHRPNSMAASCRVPQHHADICLNESAGAGHLL